MKLIDTNVLMHAVDDASPKQERARDVLNYYMGTGEAVVSLQSVVELYAALTKTAVPQKARSAAEMVLESNSFKRIQADKEAVLMALEMAEKHKLRRSGVFDALLAATAKRNGIQTIVTENKRDFEKFGLKVETI
jgi:predicted nucleic acid-binding protein